MPVSSRWPILWPIQFYRDGWIYLYVGSAFMSNHAFGLTLMLVPRRDVMAEGEAGMIPCALGLNIAWLAYHALAKGRIDRPYFQAWSDVGLITTRVAERCGQIARA